MPATKVKVTTPVALDDNFFNQVSGAIQGTWQVIGSDLIAAAAEMGERVTNDAALEAVLDANYMSTNGWPKEEAIIDAACDQHGYDKVFKFLKKKCKGWFM